MANESTHAMVGFRERVVADPVALGEEPARYYQLALADHEAEPSAIDPALVGGGCTVSAPLLRWPRIRPTGDDTCSSARSSSVNRLPLVR
jgi:hypothetical protein